jgi:Ala-tRNA(Pro) deacylase
MTDLIQVVGRGVGDIPRRGEILETLGESTSPHYRVRWDDGHESILYPGPGTLVRRSLEWPQQTPSSVRPLIELLSDAGVTFEVLPHRRTVGATAEASALGVLPEATAKTVVVYAGDERVRVVVAGPHRVSIAKLSALLGSRVRLATEDELAEAYTEFEVGAVPPFGAPPERVIVDAHVAGHHSVIVEGGSHEVSLRLAPRDMIAIAAADVADVSSR